MSNLICLDTFSGLSYYEELSTAMEYAVFKTGGKQYRVKPGDTLDVEKLSGTSLSIGSIAQLEKYDDLEPNIDFLSDYTKRSNNLDFAGKIRIDADNDAIFAFGKYTGQKVIQVFKSDKGYYSWIMKGDFPEYTKKIFTKLKLSLINDK